MDPTEAMFDHLLGQYALLTGFEQQVAAGQAPSVPDELANNPRARACFGAIRLVFGDAAFTAFEVAEGAE